MAEDIWKGFVTEQFPSILGLKDVPNNIVRRGEDMQGLVEGESRIKPQARSKKKAIPLSFETAEQAKAAKLPSGTKVIINGKQARIQ